MALPNTSFLYDFSMCVLGDYVYYRGTTGDVTLRMYESSGALARARVTDGVRDVCDLLTVPRRRRSWWRS